MYDQEKHLANQVRNALAKAGLTPEETPAYSDQDLLKIKNLGKKGLRWLRHHYPAYRVILPPHRRRGHVYTVVLSADQRIVLRRDDGGYAVLYDPEMGMLPYKPEEHL